MKDGFVQCPGCGVQLPDLQLEPHGGYLASGECRQLYDELAAYNMSRSDPFFIHQPSVDAYGAQHTGGNTRPITTVFALIGLYLAVERQFTGKQVQRAHMELAKSPNEWRKLESPPYRTWALTVAEVVQAGLGDERDEMLKRWAADVWKS